MRDQNFRTLMLALVILVFSNFAQAKTKPAPVAPPAAPANFSANPASIRTQLLSNNNSLLSSLYSVEDAKNQIDLARANLLPSLNIGGTNLGSMIFGGPGFILSQFQFLLPFLLPSNYFALNQANDTFQADLLGFKILELNTYSSALSIYYTILADQKVAAAYEEEANNLGGIYQYLVHEQNFFGDVPPEQLSQAKGNYETSQANSLQFKATVGAEIAALRQALGLPLSTQIVLDDMSMPVSQWENQDTQKVIDQALKVSPEVQQTNYLVKAAEEGSYNKEFSWLNSFLLAGRSTNGEASTSTYAVSGSATLGLGTFPTVKISERNIVEIQNQLTNIAESDTSLLEATLGNVTNAIKEVDLNTQAQADLQETYFTKEKQYEEGAGTLLDALTAHTQLTQATVARIQAEMTLNIQRVTLQRTLLEGEFANIQGCKAKAIRDNGGGFLGGLFGGKPKKQSIDQICYEGGSRQKSK